YKGVAQIPGALLRGFPGWFVTRTYHLYQLPLLTRKLHVVTDWTTSLFFRRDIAELGSLGHPEQLGSRASSPSGLSVGAGRDSSCDCRRRRSSSSSSESPRPVSIRPRRCRSPSRGPTTCGPTRSSPFIAPRGRSGGRRSGRST